MLHFQSQQRYRLSMFFIGILSWWWDVFLRFSSSQNSAKAHMKFNYVFASNVPSVSINQLIIEYKLMTHIRQPSVKTVLNLKEWEKQRGSILWWIANVFATEMTSRGMLCWWGLNWFHWLEKLPAIFCFGKWHIVVVWVQPIKIKYWNSYIKITVVLQGPIGAGVRGVPFFLSGENLETGYSDDQRQTPLPLFHY